mmetsp:Transcript_27313/g.40373  ORF Transcript_27313/g.40373 Transcript_27313/m.40373 type:complete len:243 (+) Transcript_27313:75-803(+)|eukprot:CAMPEP_0194086978 /NCGR_PEP_ID=MMETSP0149-20130528/23275_1 /TAXON_ID=122233 /ORGANISM="Chaetoceros debilis, Strain MM31A-1" /LENGTH=242 /DNA_ID=CAMNT_0038770213 /DNA_START=15 /DNA_END=743 /DNA_ORIENTATION=+
MLKRSSLYAAFVLLVTAQNINCFIPTKTFLALKTSVAITPLETTTNLSAIDPSLVTAAAAHLVSDTDSFSSSIVTSLSPLLSNDNISKAFNVATFGPQLLWVLMILLPNTTITKKIMGTQAPIIAFSLVHLFIVIASASQKDGTAPIAEFNDVFDPSGNPQLAMVNMMRYPNFVSEEWSHVLTWDLFVGRMVWLDGIKRGIFTGHSVLFCNLIGPPGYLIHCATCLLTGKGLVGNEVPEDDE